MNIVMRLDYSIIFILIIFITSCKYSNENEVDLLKEEVIVIHDEVMPLMNDLSISRKKILGKIEELAENTSEEDSTIKALKIKSLKKVERVLEDAFQGMFIWMRQYNSQFENMPKEDVKNYLQEQKEMVTKVNSNIKNSLVEAQKHL
jgi:hypothetical protein